MASFIRSRADALVNKYNSANVDLIMDLFCEDSTFSDYCKTSPNELILLFGHVLYQNTNLRLGVVFHAVDLDKAATQSFFTHLMSANPNTTFITRNVTGTHDFVAHEMAIEFRAGEDVKAMGIRKGQFVRMAGVSLQSWRRHTLGASGQGDCVEDWKVWNQKEYFYLDEVKN